MLCKEYYIYYCGHYCITTRGNQSSGPLSVCPTRAGEAMLEAAMQAERGAEGGGAGWRCAGGGSHAGGRKR